MPVHERGYTHWRPTGLRPDPVWWVIARRGWTGAWRHRWTLLLLFVAWVPAVVKGAIIFVKAKAGQLLELAVGGQWTSITPSGFLAFLEGQRFFVFLFTMILGAGLIARDRRDNGLALYFSRPLGLADYLLGKTLVVLGGYLAVTLAPVLLLCLFAYLIDPGATGVELLLMTPLRALLFCSLTGAGLSLVLLALSSLATRTVLVVVWWAVLCLGGEMVGAIGEGIGLAGLQYANVLGHWHNAGSLLMGAEPRLPVPPLASLALCALAVIAALAILRARIRPVEVVS
jgi:ABC-type transport system involved in multi-copper enzyme maturation permease subunit